ncbi:MAG: RNA pyrophosphohydrolase [Paracoccaceae bacterium]
MTPEEIRALPYRRNVGVVVLNAEGRIFAGQRIDHNQNAWQMPQGGIDPGETARQAALRELTEETGIDAEKVSIIAETGSWLPYDLPHELVPKLWNGKYRGQEQKWFLLRFTGTDADINIETEHPEFSSWRWMSVEDLLESIVPFKRVVYEGVVAAFSEHLKTENAAP